MLDDERIAAPRAEPLAAEDIRRINDSAAEYRVRWHKELQPSLGEVQLLASPKAFDAATRVAAALHELSLMVWELGTFTGHWIQVHGLIMALREAMREELGVPDEPEPEPISLDEWPWFHRRHQTSSERTSPSGGDSSNAIDPS
jgi:hypothetical protein